MKSKTLIINPEWKYAQFVSISELKECEQKLAVANARIKRLEQEVQVLRLYGNKDCTAQADAALAAKEAKP